MRVLFFAHLKDVTGCEFMELDLESAHADTLWEHLIRAYPGLAQHRNSVRLACNGEYVDPETRFRAGDELALIPPVSGG